MKKRFLNLLLFIYQTPFILLFCLGLILILSPSFPRIWYKLNQKAIAQDTNSILEQSKNEINIKELILESENNQEPPIDYSLPHENMLIIKKIGVKANIIENNNGKEALSKGVWRTYSAGIPEDEFPIILASHRFGAIDWNSDYRTKNSFYLLPQLKYGDKATIIWNQRKYNYELFYSSKGTDFEEIPSDLILYTCEWYNTPIRIFKYFKRIEN